MTSMRKFSVTQLPDEEWFEENCIRFSNDPLTLQPGTLEALQAYEVKRALGGARLRAALCSAPFWMEGERVAREEGGEKGVEDYWKALFDNERNLERPPLPDESSTAEEPPAT